MCEREAALLMFVFIGPGALVVAEIINTEMNNTLLYASL